MAKSLRSKNKLAHRTTKRHDPKSDYAVAEATRTNALAARLAKGINKPKLHEQEGEGDEAKLKEDQEEHEVEAMQTEDADKQADKKVSTSAPRGSRHQGWRKVKAKGARNASTSVTGRSGNKGHRRRR